MKQMPLMLNTQKGMSSISWLAIIVLVGFFALSAIKLIPVYIEYYAVISILDDMNKDPSLKGQAASVISNAFQKRLSIETSVQSITKDTYSIKKVKGRKSFMVEVNYEVRKTLIGNISLVAAFQHSVEVGG